MSSFRKERLVAQAIALNASQIIMDYYKKDFRITDKPDDEGPVTEADIAANDYIVQALQKAFPDDAILSEEGIDDVSRQQALRTWCIDPIDGTREFISKNGEFAIHIGLIIDQKAAFGLVHLPVHRVTMWGSPDEGSFIQKDTLIEQVHCSKRSIEDFVLIITRSHYSPEDENLKTRLKARNTFRFGSVGGKGFHLSQGKADAFFYSTGCTKEWDSCAPEAIVRGAGGMVTDINGKDLVYNKTDVHNKDGILFSNGLVHQDILQKFQTQA